MQIKMTDTLNATGCIEVCCANATSTVNPPANKPVRNRTHDRSALSALVVNSCMASVDFIFLHNEKSPDAGEKGKANE
jgi:hypothetical protein